MVFALPVVLELKALIKNQYDDYLIVLKIVVPKNLVRHLTYLN